MTKIKVAVLDLCGIKEIEIYNNNDMFSSVVEGKALMVRLDGLDSMGIRAIVNDEARMGGFSTSLVIYKDGEFISDIKGTVIFIGYNAIDGTVGLTAEQIVVLKEKITKVDIHEWGRKSKVHKYVIK